jgi:putative transposase
MTHSFKMHYFHLIWSTKDRYPYIDVNMQPKLYAYIAGIVQNSGYTLMEIGGMPDHVHLLVHMTNLDQYSAFIRDVKTHSTLWIKKNFSYAEKFKWQEGFASLSVSYSSIEKIRNYIKNQNEHHRTLTFEEEYFKFLDIQKIKYEKQFVLG